MLVYVLHRDQELVWGPDGDVGSADHQPPLSVLVCVRVSVCALSVNFPILSKRGSERANEAACRRRAGTGRLRSRLLSCRVERGLVHFNRPSASHLNAHVHTWRGHGEAGV